MQEDVSFFDVVAFFNHDIRDLPDALAQHVRISLGPHFTRSSDQGDQILPGDAPGLHRNDVLVGLVNAVPDDSPDNEDHRQSDSCLMPNLH